MTARPLNFHLTDVFFTKSSDDGLTWATATDITNSVTVSEGDNPGPPGMYPDTPWGWAVVGPGHGIQIQNGPHAGRLIVGGDHRETSDNSGKSWSHAIYSDDHGVTWHLGGGLVGLSDPNLNHANDRSNENSIVELAGGVLYMSIRVNRAQQHWRGASYSFDGGLSWTTMQPQNDLSVFQVEGSVVRLNDNVILFSSPASTRWDDETRHELTIWASYDDGQSWVKKKVVFFGYSGYSDMTVVGPDTVLLTFARGWTGGLGQADSGVNSTDFYAEIGLCGSIWIGWTARILTSSTGTSTRRRRAKQPITAARAFRITASGTNAPGPARRAPPWPPDTWTDRPATPRCN